MQEGSGKSTASNTPVEYPSWGHGFAKKKKEGVSTVASSIQYSNRKSMGQGGSRIQKHPGEVNKCTNIIPYIFKIEIFNVK